MRKENGRSMIEMLGVLAIIGVISIGGISLYRRAVDTNKANNIFDDVNRFEFVISERVFRTPRGFIDKADFKPISGFDMTAYNEPELASHHISILSVPKSVCRIVLDKGEKDYVMYANNLIFEGDSSICRDTNEMRFYFGDTSDLCSFPDTDAGQIACSDGCLCDGDNVCKTDIYNPNYPLALAEESTVCCPKDNNIVACNGKCISNDCGTGKTLDRKTCQCVCADSIKQLDENGNCVCKTSGSSVALVEGEDGKCKCNNDEYMWIDSLNKCTKFSCTGEGGTCKLDDLLCGVNCQNVDNYSTVTCNRECRPDLCPTNYPFERFRVNSYKYDMSGYHWGCRITDKTPPTSNTVCYVYYTTQGLCFNNSLQHQCCTTNSDLECTKGLCDESYCQERFGNSVSYGKTLYFGGCLFNNGEIQCLPTDTSKTNWACYRGETSCATNCTTPPNCGTCSDACSGLGASDGNGYCCVTFGTKTICKNDRDYFFKDGTSYNRCGVSCTYGGLTKQDDGSYTISSISCTRGHCSQPVCSEGWEYGEVTSVDYLGTVWGCRKGDIGCVFLSGTSISPYFCNKGTERCGSRCQSFDNSDCLEWTQKPCAPMVTKNNVTKPACIYGRVQGTTDVDDYDYDCWCQGDVDEVTNICCPSGQVVRGGACVVNQ